MRGPILFVCPHGAAKSVIAAALCGALGRRQGLDLEVAIAGVEPDPALAPAAVTLLQELEQIDVRDWQPQQLTQSLLLSAERVISLGCDSGLPLWDGTNVEHWDEIPPVSLEPAAAYAAIRRQVINLLIRLQPEQTEERSGSQPAREAAG